MCPDVQLPLPPRRPTLSCVSPSMHVLMPIKSVLLARDAKGTPFPPSLVNFGAFVATPRGHVWSAREYGRGIETACGLSAQTAAFLRAREAYSLSPRNPRFAAHEPEPQLPSVLKDTARRRIGRVLISVSELPRVPVDPNDVYFLEALGDDTLVRLRSKRGLRDVRPLGTLLREFTPYGFLRVHRNTQSTWPASRTSAGGRVGRTGS